MNIERNRLKNKLIIVQRSTEEDIGIEKSEYNYYNHKSNQYMYHQSYTHTLMTRIGFNNIAKYCDTLVIHPSQVLQ